MDTAQALTDRLRRETGCSRLLARPVNDRWCIFEVLPRWTEGEDVLFRLSDSGELLPGASVVREVLPQLHMVYVHERDGAYAPPEPHEILAALRKQDKFAVNDPIRALLLAQRRRKEKARQESSDHFADLAQEHRRLFARAADEMGL